MQGSEIKITNQSKILTNQILNHYGTNKTTTNLLLNW